MLLSCKCACDIGFFMRCLDLCLFIGECVVIRVESAVDGISKAVVLLQF